MMEINPQLAHLLAEARIEDVMRGTEDGRLLRRARGVITPRRIWRNSRPTARGQNGQDEG
jgi:hypothetical protein